PETRFSANFVKLGFHPGFGLTYTLPRLIGWQRANLMFYTGRRISGEEAFAWGLGEVLTDQDNVRAAAVELAKEIAENAPLAVQSTRATMRAGLAAAVKSATDHEAKEQHRLQRTEDHKEGIRAVAERRPGRFVGRSARSRSQIVARASGLCRAMRVRTPVLQKGAVIMSANSKLRFGLWYDFRNPPAWKRPYDQLYGEILDQIVWGEQQGFEDIWL